MRGIVVSSEYALGDDGAISIDFWSSAVDLRRYLTYWDRLVHVRESTWLSVMGDDLIPEDYRLLQGEDLVDIVEREGLVEPASPEGGRKFNKSKKKELTDLGADNLDHHQRLAVTSLLNRHDVAAELNSVGDDLWSIGEAIADRQTGLELKESRTVIEFDIYRALPAPDGSTPIEVVLKFRESRRAELLRFRAAVDALIDAIQSSENLQSSLVRAREEIELALLDLHVLLDESKIQKVAGSLRTMLGFDEPSLSKAILPALAGVTAGAVTLDPAVGSVAGIGTNAALNLVVKRRPKAYSLPEKVRDFAYLYSVDSL